MRDFKLAISAIAVTVEPQVVHLKLGTRDHLRRVM